METSNVNWTRPSGPPIVWSTINAKEKLSDNTFADVRLSIQDIPEDKYDEALDHMCQYFLADEVLNKCMKTATDIHGVNDHRSIWEHCLKQGMSIGAFKLTSSDELGELVGVNIVLVSSDKIKKIIDEVLGNSKSRSVKKIFTLMHEATAKVDICKMHGVDRYIHELGISVKPTFRGQKLTVHFLEIWTDIGRKYGISVGSATFSSPMSHKQGERAGFKTLLTVRYDQLSDENGQPSFPNVEADALTVVAKQLL